MATENLILDEKRKAQLDENLKAMSESGVDNESIIAYANDFKSKYGSPKPTAPSMQGGESGAVKTPSTSTSVLEDLESGSWTQKINPQAPKPTPVQQPIVSTKKEEPKIAGTITTPVLKIAGLEEPKVIPKSYAPTVQENIAKIEGMTLKTKFPEYAKPTETFDFKKASAQAVSDEEKARQQERIQRSEQRRLDNLPKEIDKLKAERNDLMLDKSVEGRKKLAANEAVTRNFEKELEDSKKSEYKSLEKLNQGAVKGLGKEVFEYLQENPKLNDKVKSVGLNDKETYNLIQNAVQNKIAPLQQDLETFQKEGTVALAAGKINASNLIQSKQNELQGIADELNSYQNNYLKKNGFSAITEQYNQAKKKLDSYTPTIQKINKESEYYKKELNTIKEKIDSYSSKIQGNNFNGTQAELNDYNSLIKEYNETLNDLNSYPDLFKEELSGYENAVSNYNSILAKRNSIAQGLKDTEYNKLSSRYEAARLEYDSMLEQYKKYEEPAVKDRINKYFSTVSQIGEYDNKLKTAKGAMPSIEELEKAKKAFDQTGLGGDLLDIGGRAVNSILDASAKLVASPLRLAASFSDFAGRDNVYHYSEYIADLIEGTDREPLFMTKESNNFYDAQKDKINWGVIPVVAGVADQLGILLTLAVTGKYVTPAVEGFMTTAGMDLAAAAEVSESAKIASTIAPAFLISYGDNYKEAIDKGFSSKGAIAYSGALSLLEGITEMIIPDKELLFGKDGKSILLNRFIKDYAKGKKYAVKRLAEGFLYNAFGEATEENIAAIGKTFATTIGHAIDKDIQIDIPTINQTITTSVKSGLTGGGMGIIGQVSEETNMYKMGVAELAKNFQSGKDLLTALKNKGKIEEKRYDKLITDAQKYQAVVGKIPKGLSQFKTIAIAEKMIAINELYSQMDKDEKNPINKINKKKIDSIQDEIAGIIDDKEFDSKFQDQLNNEADDINEQSQPDIALKKYTGATNEKYGYIDRGDGKGKVELTKEEFLEEMKKKAAEARKRGEEVAFRKEQEAAAFLEEQRKKRDAEVEELKLIRPDLTDDDMLLIDLPDSVDKALDRLEANIPTDMVQVNEAIEALDEKFEQLQAYKNDPKRTHTIEQIDEVVDMLSEAKSKLQFYQLEIENHESRQQQQKSSEGKSETEISETGAVAEKAETQPTTTEQVEEVKLAELPTKTIQAELVEEKPKPTEQPALKEEKSSLLNKEISQAVESDNSLSKEDKDFLSNLNSSIDISLKEALRAFDGYKKNDYAVINKLLRSGKEVNKENLIKEGLPSEVAESILDDYIKISNIITNTKFTPKKNITLYRAIFGGKQNFDKYKIGDSFFEKAFTSTTIDEDWVKDNYGKIPVIKFELNSNDSVNGFYIGGAEKEFILNKNIPFKVKKKETINGNDVLTLELDKEKLLKPTKDEQETKKENGEPMPTGVQGVRTEGERGQESAELRTQEEEVTPQAGSVVGGDVSLNKERERLKTKLEKLEYQDPSTNVIVRLNSDGTFKDAGIYNEKGVWNSSSNNGEQAIKNAQTESYPRVKKLYDIDVKLNEVLNSKLANDLVYLKEKLGGLKQLEQAFEGLPYEQVGSISYISKSIDEFLKSGLQSNKLDGISKAVESLLSKEQSTPTTQEKVSGGLTQEEKTNLETIAKEAGVNFQEVRNVYNKYGEGKSLSEITLEDYQKAQEKRDKGKEGKFNQSASEFNVGDIIVDKIGVVFKVLKIGKAFTKVQNLSDTGIPNKIEEFANVYKGFEKSNLTEKQAEEKRNKETPALTKSENEQLDKWNSHIEAYLSKIEGLNNDIEAEKNNLKEEKQRIKDEIAEVRESSMSKADKAKKIEELNAELQDIIDSAEKTIKSQKDKIATYEEAIKKYEEKKADYKEKEQVTKEAKTEEGAPTITVEEEKQKPQLPKTRKERLDSLREKAKKLKGAKPVSSAVGAVMTKAREALNWIKQKAGVKETKISERNPLLTEAAKRLKNGEITNEEYRAILNENSPIAPITTFFDPATGQQVENSVDASKRKNANKPVASGTRVGLRIDIPAFRNNNIWVVSVHDGLKKAGEILSYKNAARITNVVFGTQSPKASLEIAAGGQKTAMVGRIFGDWNDLEGKTEDEKGETAKKLVEEIVNDPSWVQVGMNPFRQSYFYDRSSQLGRPVLSADEVVQIGGLVYAKNVKYGNWTDEAFRVKGLLDKAGKPVQFSKGKRMSDVENFISSSIEEGYPLDEVSEIVQEMWGKSEAEANKLIDKYKPTKTTKNAVQEPSTKREVSPTGEGRKDITEGGEGVGQGKQGEKATQEGVQEKIDALVDKSLPASERRKIMQENPLIKRIFDNIKELHKQLEEKGLITKEGNCP